MNHIHKRGFTLTETLVVFGILVLLLGIVLASFSSFRGNYVLEGEVQKISSLIRDARSRTISGRDGIEYGIHLGSSSVTIFRGALYDPNSNTNEVSSLDQRVTLGDISLNGGGADIVFIKIKGTTQNYGSATLVLVEDIAKFKRIVTKPSGLVEIQ